MRARWSAWRMAVSSWPRKLARSPACSSDQRTTRPIINFRPARQPPDQPPCDPAPPRMLTSARSCATSASDVLRQDRAGSARWHRSTGSGRFCREPIGRNDDQDGTAVDDASTISNRPPEKIHDMAGPPLFPHRCGPHPTVQHNRSGKFGQIIASDSPGIGCLRSARYTRGGSASRSRRRLPPYAGQTLVGRPAARPGCRSGTRHRTCPRRRSRRTTAPRWASSSRFNRSAPTSVPMQPET